MRIWSVIGGIAILAGAPAARVGDGIVPTIGETPLEAQTGGLSQAGFVAFLPSLRQQAERAGVSRTTIDRVFPTLTFSSRTIELDRAQPGGAPGSNANPPYEPYRVRHITPTIVSRGRARFSENRSQLNEIGRRYGVPPSILIAIWGKETSYGTIMGDFDLLNSLASLAYEGRRRQLFTDEFIATLKMMDRGFPRSQLTGSWAGATGQSQFLPSVYIRLGVDGDGDGRADIWRSRLDALASIANYLRSAGWRPGQPWGIAVRVPSGFDRSTIANRLRSPRCPRVHERHSRWLSAAEWRSRGIGNNLPDRTMASLLEPDGPGRTAYLLTTNYRTILDYNCSNFYALTIGLLADSVSS
jgi:membrane-bound lytic murein transglycosylase B